VRKSQRESTMRIRTEKWIFFYADRIFSQMRLKNIIVELKHPLIRLGEKELTQVKTYMNVILKEPEFNGNNMSWEFFLVGSTFNTKKEIENALEMPSPMVRNH
jgi:hypothetical protein